MDSKISIWKRFGGWLRGSVTPPAPETDREAPELDDDGLIIEPQPAAESLAPAPPSTSLFSRFSKKHQVAAVEESFNRLVDMLESINDSVVQQREVSAQLARYVKELPDLSSLIPQAIADQKDLIKEVTEQVQSQSLHYQELMDILKDMPDLAQSQIDQLRTIAQQMQSSSRSTEKMNGSVQRMEAAMQQTLAVNQAQQQSLNIIEDLFQKSEQRTEQLIKNNNRRFIWIAALILLVTLILGSATAAVLWFLYHKA